MAEEVRWKEAGEEGYFPATFAEEGFSHATEQPHLVLPVANRLLTGLRQGARFLVEKNETDFSLSRRAMCAQTIDTYLLL